MVQNVAHARAAELTLRKALSCVPGAGSGGLMRVVRLHGGTVNTSYRVDTRAGTFVVRVQHAVAESLGANHAREAQLHAAAAAAGLAPALIHVDAVHRFMVMNHVEGPIWSPQDFSRPERLTQLGAVLKALHALSPPQVAPFDIAAVLRMHYERLSEAAPQEQGQFASLMERATAALEACGTRQRPLALVHNDLHHSNLIGFEPLYLLDWEYGAVADPLFDLASVLAYYPQAAEHAGLLLASSGLAGMATREMLQNAAWLFVLVSYFWHRSRRLAGPAEAESACYATEQSLLDRLR